MPEVTAVQRDDLLATRPQFSESPQQPEAWSLLDGPESLVIVRALAGMGKTHLVRSWVERQQRQNGGLAVRYASARDLQPSPLHLAQSHSASVLALDDAEALPVALRDQLLDQLRADPARKLILCYSTLSDRRAGVGLEEAAAAYGLSAREIGAGQLKLSERQTASSLAIWAGSQPSSRRAREVHEAVDGWPALVRIIARASTGDIGDEQTLTLPAVSSATRAAIDTAISDQKLLLVVRRMALAPELVPLHFDVLERTGSEAGTESVVGEDLLSALGVLGFFEQRHAGSSARRLVPAIREVLVDDARLYHPADFRRWNRRFAEELMRHGGREEIWIALSHARAAEAWDLMSQLWGSHSLGLLNRNFLATAEAFSGLPESAMQEEPSLRLGQAVLAGLAAAYSQGTGTQDTSLRASTRTATRLAAALGPDSSANSIAIVLSVVIISQRVSGAIDGALETAQKLAVVLRESAARGDSASDSTLAWVALQRAVTLLLVDNVAESIVLATHAYELAVGAGIDAEHVVANAAAHLALCSVLIGSENEAAEWLRIASGHHSDKWYSALGLAPARIAESMLAIERLDRLRAARATSDMGDGSAAVEMWPFVAVASARHELTFGEPVVMLAELERISRAHKLGRRVASAGGTLILARTRADGLIAAAEAARAVEVLQSAAHEHLDAQPENVPQLIVTYARAHLYGGRSKKAALLALQAVNSSEVEHSDQIEALFVLAEAQLRNHAPSEAQATFGRAHALAERRGAWRAYLTIPRTSMMALLHATGVTLAPDVLARIENTTLNYPESAQIFELSARENVVLGSLFTGGTTASIAAALSVSPNTVKSQIASIFTKLGVRDRETALLVAERRGLIQRDS